MYSLRPWGRKDRIMSKDERRRVERPAEKKETRQGKTRGGPAMRRARRGESEARQGKECAAVVTCEGGRGNMEGMQDVPVECAMKLHEEQLRSSRDEEDIFVEVDHSHGPWREPVLDCILAPLGPERKENTSIRRVILNATTTQERSDASIQHW